MDLYQIAYVTGARVCRRFQSCRRAYIADIHVSPEIEPVKRLDWRQEVHTTRSNRLLQEKRVLTIPTLL